MRICMKFKIIFVVIVVFIILSSQESIYAQFTNINITNNSPGGTRPMVAISHIDQNKAVVIFSGGITEYSYTSNGGVTWSLPAPIDSLGCLIPQICTDNSGNFYVAAKIDSNRLAIYKSTNGGISFPRKSIIPGATITGGYPTLAYDLSPNSPYANTLYVAWGLHYISKSTDGGTTWSIPVSTGQGGYGPVIAISSSGQINQLSFLAGQQGAQDIYHYNRSTDGGITFSPDRAVDSGLTLSAFFTLFFPTITTDISGGSRNGYIYFTFSAGNEATQGRTVDCFLTRSTDNGNTWSPHIKINTDTGSFTYHHKPAIAVNNSGNIAINYYDFRNSPPFNTMCEDWLARSTDGGINFTNEKVSTCMSSRAASDHGNIGMDYWGNKIIPVWTDLRISSPGFQIYSAIVQSFTVSGQVVYKDNNQPVSSGFVKALHYESETGEVVVMDSAVIQPGGLYTFTHFPSHDSVDIMVYQNDDNLDFVPTYYDSTTRLDAGDKNLCYSKPDKY